MYQMTRKPTFHGLSPWAQHEAQQLEDLHGTGSRWVVIGLRNSGRTVANYLLRYLANYGFLPNPCPTTSKSAWVPGEMEIWISMRNK